MAGRLRSWVCALMVVSMVGVAVVRADAAAPRVSGYASGRAGIGIRDGDPGYISSMKRGASTAQTSKPASLTRLPAAAPSVISATLAAQVLRSVPRRDRRGWRLAGGGVRGLLDPDGVSLTGVGGSVRLALVGVGRGLRLRALGRVTPRAIGHRVLYAPGGGVREWFAAGPLGVEQVFSLTRRPTGGSGSVSLALAVSGLRAHRSGSGIVFLDRSGRVLLRYSGLRAADARGRRLRAWLSISKSRVIVHVADRDAAYPLRIDPFIQQGPKLVGSDAAAPSFQGLSVALSADGDTALIGGPDDNGDVGAAWVFVRSGSTWIQQGPKLVDASGREQGSSVALSADGNTALIGEPGTNSNAGAGVVFARSGSTWTQQGSRLVGTDASDTANQGSSVALSADGNTAVIGGPLDDDETGAAWVFTRVGSSWTQQGSKLVGTGATGSHAAEGSSVALSADGSTALLGGPEDNNGAGATWVFAHTGSSWTQQGSKLVGTGATGPYVAEQGASVALSGNGGTALIGGPQDDDNTGAAWVFTRTDTSWTQQGSKLVGSDAADGYSEQGTGVALSAAGNTALIGGSADEDNSGATWVFARSRSTWGQQGPRLVAADATSAANQGSSVSLSADGTTALIGGFGDDSETGAAWVFGVPAAPSATIITPTQDRIYATNQHVTTAFACVDGTNAPGISSCADDSGHGSPGTLNTSTPGVHTYTVTATSHDGQTATASVSYTVSTPTLPRRPLARIHITPAAAGLRYHLTSAGSHAPTGHRLTQYAWSVAGHRAGTTASITPTLTRAGQPVRIVLTVTDDQRQTASTTRILRPRSRVVHVRLVVHFARDHAHLTRTDRKVLNPARPLIRYATQVAINGYCAANEPSTRHLLIKLSRQRAQTTRTYLFEGDHRPQPSTTIKANGATHFTAANHTPTGRAQNRRATVTFIYPRPLL